MTAGFLEGETAQFDDLPAAADCTATETDTRGAKTTTSSGTTADETVKGTDVITLALTADDKQGEATNTVAFGNTFKVGSLLITKKLEGDGKDGPTVGTFTVEVSCALGDTPVYQGTLTLSRDKLTEEIKNLPDRAECTVTEPDAGGATGTVITPAQPVTIDGNSAHPKEVTITNTFLLGSVAVTKAITGDGADQVNPKQEFTVRLSCQITVNGEVKPIDLPDGGVHTLSVESGLTYTWEKLPDGAICEVAETDDGGASASDVTPKTVTVDGRAKTPAELTVTNRFDVGSLAIVKKLDGDGAGAAADKTFTVALSCTYQLGDTTTPVVLPDGGRAKVSKDNDYRAVFEGLSAGAKCDVTEPDAGGADRTTIDPEAVTVGDGTVVTVTVTNTFHGPTPTTPPTTTPPTTTPPTTTPPTTTPPTTTPSTTPPTGSTTPPGAGNGGNGGNGNGGNGNGGPVSDTGGQVSGSGTGLLVGSGLAALLAALSGAWLVRRRRDGSTH